MDPEKEVVELPQGAGLAEDPSAQSLWDEIDAIESAGGDAGAAPAADEPRTTPEADAKDTQQQAPAPAADADAAADPYAGVPQHVRDEILGLKETVAQVVGRLRNAEGNIGGLKNSIQRELTAAAAAATKAGAEAPTKQEIDTASGSASALKELMEEYPQFGETIKKVLDGAAAEHAAQINSLRQELNKQPAAGEDAALERQRLQDQVVDLTIRIAHPKWKAITADPKFDPWVATQPREVQRLRYSDNPDDVIRLLDIKAEQDAAKAASERTATDAQNRRRGAANMAAGIPSGRSAAAIKTKDVDDMDPEEYWKHLDRVEAGVK